MNSARSGMVIGWEAVRDDLNLPAHFKAAVGRHKTFWLSGAAIIGWVLAKLPARQKKVYVDRHNKKAVKQMGFAGLLLGVLKLVFSLARPALTAFATKKLADVAQTKEKIERPADANYR
ncbi:MAG: hypothetical protein M3O82_05200 [Verrucomicrobiota bacterium]|nr:hypothetical protein [Verrucomicrobiota bacterium]